MPSSLKNSFTKAVGEFTDDIVDQVSDVTDKFGRSTAVIKRAGSRTNDLAKETMQLCRETEMKTKQMMEFGTELKETLTGVTTTSTGERGVDANSFETIQELLSGDTVHSAMSLATDVKGCASKCIDKSIEMTTLIEDTIEKLPEPLHNVIDKAMKNKEGNDIDGPSMQLTTLDRDIADVQECVQTIQEMNLFTALTIGLKSFEQFTLKAQVSRDLFNSIHNYSRSVSDITETFRNLNVKTVVSKVKDLWKCLKLSSLMRQLAQGLKKLSEKVIDLFEATSTKVASLWKSLAFAKDCMRDCIEQAMQAKSLCIHAVENSTILIEKSFFIKDQLEDIKELNKGSFAAFRELSDGEEISTAITIATDMDALVLKCAEKAVAMVDRVQEGYRSLPSMITEDMPHDAGKDENDPESPNLDANLVELRTCKEAIEKSNVLTAVKTESRGFTSVAENVDVSKQLLSLVQNFSESCIQTIDHFLGVWDIESAMEKIKEMYRIASLGELIKQFASQIKCLLIAVIELLKASIHKIKNLSLSDLNMKDFAGQAVEMANDLDMDDLKSGIKKLGSLFKRK